MLTDAVRFIRAHDDFVLISHVSPDGDTLGSALALYQGLLFLGKKAQIVCADAVPAIYRFLPCSNEVIPPEKAKKTEAVIAVDCADYDRTGAAGALILPVTATLNIDHHDTNTNYLKANYVRHVAAAGELIYGLLLNLAVPVSKPIAACLYTALVTDTGNFAYSNTTPDTLRIAAELLEAGIDLPELNRLIFRTKPLQKVKLLGRAIDTAEIHADGRISICALSKKDFADCGAAGEDTEGVIDSLRDIDTVEIAALLREDEDGSIRVSLRGKRSADVSKIASEFGGGGHRLAAGCTMHMPLSGAKDTILAAAKKLLAGENG